MPTKTGWQCPLSLSNSSELEWCTQTPNIGYTYNENSIWLVLQSTNQKCYAKLMTLHDNIWINPTWLSSKNKRRSYLFMSVYKSMNARWRHFWDWFHHRAVLVKRKSSLWQTKPSRNDCSWASSFNKHSPKQRSWER